MKFLTIIPTAAGFALVDPRGAAVGLADDIHFARMFAEAPTLLAIAEAALPALYREWQDAAAAVDTAAIIRGPRGAADAMLHAESKRMLYTDALTSVLRAKLV